MFGYQVCSSCCLLSHQSRSRPLKKHESTLNFIIMIIYLFKNITCREISKEREQQTLEASLFILKHKQMRRLSHDKCEIITCSIRCCAPKFLSGLTKHKTWWRRNCVFFGVSMFSHVQTDLMLLVLSCGTAAVFTDKNRYIQLCLIVCLCLETVNLFNNLISVSSDRD